MRLFAAIILAALAISPVSRALAERVGNDDLTLQRRVEVLERQLHETEAELKLVEDHVYDWLKNVALLAAVVCGGICALWAQNSGRSPWLWFFGGFFLNVIGIVLMLSKNGHDQFDRRVFGRTTGKQRRLRKLRGDEE